MPVVNYISPPLASSFFFSPRLYSRSFHSIGIMSLEDTESYLNLVETCLLNGSEARNVSGEKFEIMWSEKYTANQKVFFKSSDV